MVGPGRVERPTSRLSGVRSNHLSYKPDEVFVLEQYDRPTRRHPRAIAQAFDGKGRETKAAARPPYCLVSIGKRREAVDRDASLERR